MSAFLSGSLIVAFGLVYTIGYLVLVFFTVGAGEGTFIFVPALLTWPLVLISLVLISWADRQRVRSLFVILMFLHYVVSFIWAFLIEMSDQFGHSWKYLSRETGLFSLCAVWYIAGQLILWILFGKQVAKAQSN
jgi:hypothetical protein